MEDDNGIPAEVIEVIGVTGMHGEAMQIKCRILEGNNKGRIITRNSMGPIRIGDVLMLLETAREAKKLTSRLGRWKRESAASAIRPLSLARASSMPRRTERYFSFVLPNARTTLPLAG